MAPTRTRRKPREVHSTSTGAHLPVLKGAQQIPDQVRRHIWKSSAHFRPFRSNSTNLAHTGPQTPWTAIFLWRCFSVVSVPMVPHGFVCFPSKQCDSHGAVRCNRLFCNSLPLSLYLSPWISAELAGCNKPGTTEKDPSLVFVVAWFGAAIIQRFSLQPLAGICDIRVRLWFLPIFSAHSIIANIAFLASVPQKCVQKCPSNIDFRDGRQWGRCFRSARGWESKG